MTDAEYNKIKELAFEMGEEGSFGYSHAFSILSKLNEWQKQQMKEALQTEYEKGRFDMIEEMMKDACDTKITTDKGSIFPIIKYQLPLTYDCKIGDKVKIIVIR